MQSQLGRVMQMTLSGQARGLSTLAANSEIAAMDTLSSSSWGDAASACDAGNHTMKGD